MTEGLAGRGWMPSTIPHGRGCAAVYQEKTGDTLQHHQELHIAADVR